jgi:outer membrane protein with beta-barrel domain
MSKAHLRLRLGCAMAAVIFAAALFPSSARAQGFVDNSKWEIGGHYALLHLPSQCSSTTCDTTNNGLGANLSYNFSSWMGFDSEMNFFGSNGDAPTPTTGGNVTEGLFGFRLGPTTRRWGFYSVVRPGFVNFSRVLDANAAGSAILPPGGAAKFAGVQLPSATANPVGPSGVPQFSATLRYQAAADANPLAVMGFTSATYFAFNYGEAIEWRPTRHAALRFDVGDTIVAYPGSTVGTPLHQHNFQISQAIIIRF